MGELLFPLALIFIALAALFGLGLGRSARQRSKALAIEVREGFAHGKWQVAHRRETALGQAYRAVYVVCRDNGIETSREFVGRVPDGANADWAEGFESLWQQGLERAAHLNATMIE